MSKNPGEEKKISSKAKRIAMIVAASLVGVSVTTVISAICVYDSFFERYERPDYALYPGLYCYERVAESLPRELLKIPSGENMLQGYYYPSPSAKGLVVLAHGFHAGADDYIPLILEIVKRGYAVLTYDVTGTYSSEGESIIGMCQSVCDLDRVLTFAAKEAPFSEMPKFVLGHSWGGYAASSVLALHSEVRAAVLLAPMNNGVTMMVEKGEQYAGKLAYTGKPIMDTYQRILFGNYVKYNGVAGINSTDIPILIAQGVDDTVITPDGQSITAHLGELTNPNVTVYWGKGSQGSHTGIWHSDASEEYQRVVKSELKLRELTLGRALTDEEKKEFYSSVDHALYSEVNGELLDLIIQTLNQGLKK